MTPDVAMRVGMAVGLHYRNGHRQSVVIGKDTRRSGYLIENALTAGFLAVGVDVFLLGPIPTPAVAMLTRSLRADYGVMISASHNPFEDNGIKLFGPDGFKLSDEAEAQIEVLIDSDMSARLAAADQLGRAKRIDGALERYVEAAKRTLPRQMNFEGLRVVVDCANGAGQGRAHGARRTRCGGGPTRRRAGWLEHQPRSRLDFTEGFGREGEGNARRSRHRPRRGCRPRRAR